MTVLALLLHARSLPTRVLRRFRPISCAQPRPPRRALLSRAQSFCRPRGDRGSRISYRKCSLRATASIILQSRNNRPGAGRDFQPSRKSESRAFFPRTRLTIYGKCRTPCAGLKSCSDPGGGGRAVPVCRPRKALCPKGNRQ